MAFPTCWFITQGLKIRVKRFHNTDKKVFSYICRYAITTKQRFEKETKDYSYTIFFRMEIACCVCE